MERPILKSLVTVVKLRAFKVMGNMLKAVIAVAVAGIVARYILKQQYNYSLHDMINSNSVVTVDDVRSTTIVDHGTGVGESLNKVQRTDRGRELWRYIGTHSGVETYVKEIEGSKLLAFRGTGNVLVCC